MSFRLALPRKALTSSSPDYALPGLDLKPTLRPGVLLERSGDPFKHHQRKPLLTNHSKSLRTFTLQNQSKQRRINLLGRLSLFFQVSAQNVLPSKQRKMDS